MEHSKVRWNDERNNKIIKLVQTLYQRKQFIFGVHEPKIINQIDLTIIFIYK